ncbi:MAG: hydroxymethylglutaryl-CoA lyase [Bacteroidota bacterium]
MLNNVKITECPRDGIQGLKSFIPTSKKISYINELLKVGFDTIDLGSFVSPALIPQLRDTQDVLDQIDITSTRTKLMVLVANLRGAEIAINSEKIDFLSFPFSISPTFLKLNINSTLENSWSTIERIHNLCEKNGKELKVYIAMAFGNPYNDECNSGIILQWVDIFNSKGIKFINLSDVTGVSTSENISDAYSQLIPGFPVIEFGFHLHTRKDTWFEKVDSAFNSGCRSFDSVIRGMGGCPMTNYELVGNLDTSDLLGYLKKKGISHGLNEEAYAFALTKSKDLETC